ncbi:MAG: FAD-dependent oxidoreductase [Pseudomonadota bacterium]
MRIAVVGTGIAGNVAARKLRGEFDITVYEAESYVGGHTNTVDVVEDGRTIPVDTGFIVFNDRTYPNFISLLDEIGQDSKPSSMTFSVHAANDALEFSGTGLNGLFAQRRNLLRPTFHRMVRDILRFNREAQDDIQRAAGSVTVGDYLREQRYSDEFTYNYLVPMVAAIWSAEPAAVADMPADFLVRFFGNHGLLQLKDRPQWRVIEGGSREYVKKLVAGHEKNIRLNSAVTAIHRKAEGVEITTACGNREWFDYAFIACHSDQALHMLQDATAIEREVLGAIRYQDNEAILHTDVKVLPKRRRAWSAWNYYVPTGEQRQVSVSYNMNILQGLETRETYCVTLNDDARIEPGRIIKRIQYQHPIYTREATAAQARQSEVNSGRTYFCGAYWRNGFHEDGVVSALNAVAHFEEQLKNAQLYIRRTG